VPDRLGEVPGGAVPAAVATALADRRVMEIDYVAGSGAVTRRPVEPIGFVGLGQHWYLVAWCRLRVDHRAFRLDRIVAAKVTAEPAPRHDPPEWDCDLAVRLRQLALEA
jgi:predicted DNA-binding transcriptional regulator YafY